MDTSNLTVADLTWIQYQLVLAGLESKPVKLAEFAVKKKIADSELEDDNYDEGYLYGKSV